MTLDVVGRLELHHRRLLRRMDEAGRARQARRRRGILEKLAKELRQHFQTEDRLLFPAAQKAVLVRSDAELFGQGREAHAEQLGALEGVTRQFSDTPSISAFLYQFSVALRSHFRFEEERLFPLARRALGRQALLELAQAMPAERNGQRKKAASPPRRAAGRTKA